ncbi:CLV1 receptor kinase [Janibacter sp. HTCC2649]|uniref:LysM peptidoglycan-binding domain-containing protein n=1 Tax=Janibacter sp. HTCC2649 TaxID=313589 RepID=UPI000066EBDC|nr:LysM domain-containing protein [Janibacter sp. HTCC2649]EAP99348.1 CLV1 receptor kinase [Janibacter sp. HTCC2649]
MGFLDDVKKGLGYDDKDTVAEKAKEKADEAKSKADEAAKEAADRKADADKAAKDAGQASAPAPAPKAPAPAPKAPAPAPAPAPKAQAPAPKKAAAPAQRTYTVKKGDTLSGIGAKYDVSWKKIAKVNNIDNPDLIFPGQKFIIPD